MEGEKRPNTRIPSEPQLPGPQPSPPPGARRQLSAAELRQRSVADVKHGRYAKTAAGKAAAAALQAPILKRRAEEIDRKLEELLAVAPWIADADTAVARGFCELEVLANELFVQIRKRSLLDRHGVPKPILSEFRQLRRVAASLARELGLTTVARSVAGLNEEPPGLARRAADRRSKTPLGGSNQPVTPLAMIAASRKGIPN